MDGVHASVEHELFGYFGIVTECQNWDVWPIGRNQSRLVVVDAMVTLLDDACDMKNSDDT